MDSKSSPAEPGPQALRLRDWLSCLHAAEHAGSPWTRAPGPATPALRVGKGARHNVTTRAGIGKDLPPSLPRTSTSYCDDDFPLGVYILPILTEEKGLDNVALAQLEASVERSGTFTRDLPGSDAFH